MRFRHYASETTVYMFEELFASFLSHNFAKDCATGLPKLGGFRNFGRAGGFGGRDNDMRDVFDWALGSLRLMSSSLVLLLYTSYSMLQVYSWSANEWNASNAELFSAGSPLAAGMRCDPPLAQDKQVELAPAPVGRIGF